MNRRTHHSDARRRLVTPAALALAAVTLPGCIVQDIFDEVEEVNTRLVALDERLDTVEQINDKLETIDASLESIDTTLTSVDTTLTNIDKTLASLDTHLAALRTTLRSLDKTIPFLNLGDDGEEEPTTAAEQAEAEAAAEGEPGQGTTEPAADAPESP